MKTLKLLLLLFTFTTVIYAQDNPTSREMNLINWQEFQSLCRKKSKQFCYQSERWNHMASFRMVPTI